MHPRVLIVGTVPYNPMSTSRAFDAYFHNWEKENLAQVFSHTKTPCQGHCGTLYQITDHRMVRRWLNPRTDTGVIYSYDDLPQAWQDNGLEVKGQAMNRAYAIGRRHTPLTHLLRGLLWRRRFWNTKKFNDWLDAFRPQCVFLSFSDDYFIPQIALYVAKKYNIPIVSSIGDDYYFNTHFSLNPFYLVYKYTYRALIRRVFRHGGSAIYIGDKIRDKYNAAFGLNGETVYLVSDIVRRPFRPVDAAAPTISYFGNIRMGRNYSLCAIGRALAQIDPAYCLQVYSNESDEEYYRVFDEVPSVVFHGSVPYAEVERLSSQSDVLVIVEGFAKEHVDLSRYSLSTKAADALASGAAIFVHGSAECGVVEYMQSTAAAEVCTCRKGLVAALRRLLMDEELQETYYDAACRISQAHHRLESSTAVFEGVVQQALGEENVSHVE